MNNGFEKDVFNGKLQMEWVSVKDRLPLAEYDVEHFGVLSHVYVVLVDEHDLNEDVNVVDLCYHKSKDEEGWQYSPGEEYPQFWVDKIRYWCYHPYYKLQDILDWEMRNGK